MRLILLPGLDGSGLLYDDFRAALGSEMALQVLVYPADLALTYSELAASLRKALPKQEPWLLLAESFAGPLAIELAASRPAGLVGLILCCSFAANPLPAFRGASWLVPWLPLRWLPISWCHRWLTGAFATAKTRQLLRQALATLSNPVLQTRIIAILTTDHSELLRLIEVPVWYLQARQDALVRPNAFAVIRSRLPSVQLVVMDGPHFLLQTQATAVAQWLTSIARDATRCASGFDNTTAND